jgi:hypothetical protein
MRDSIFCGVKSMVRINRKRISADRGDKNRPEFDQGRPISGNSHCKKRPYKIDGMRRNEDPGEEDIS